MGLLLPWLNLFLDILFFLMQFINEIIFLISLSDSLLLVYSIMLILPSFSGVGCRELVSFLQCVVEFTSMTIWAGCFVFCKVINYY